MAAVDPGGSVSYGPPPHELNSHLIEVLHGAVRQHRNPSFKAQYGKLLAQLLQMQASEHAAHLKTSGSAGSANSGHGQVVDTGATGDVPPAPTWSGGHSSLETPMGGLPGGPAAALPPGLAETVAAIASQIPPSGFTRAQMPGGFQAGSPMVEAALGALQRTQAPGVLGHGPVY